MKSCKNLLGRWPLRPITIVLSALSVFLVAQVALGFSGLPFSLDERSVQINEQGFGDRQNSFAWSMLWWNDKLYVGTGRSFLCVLNATWDVELGTDLYRSEYPDVECAPTPQDLELQAEIWRYTPETENWERLYQSPSDVPIPDHPDKFVARDIGFRSMALFTEPDGTEALYVGGVSSRSFNPGVPPPRILRSEDGVNFEPLPQEPGTFLGDLPINLDEELEVDRSFRSMVVYKGRLFVTVSDFRGVGVLLEAANPAGGNDNFRQVTPPDMQVWALRVFNDYLYVGLRTDNGYAVVKTDASGDPPYEFTPIVTDGAFKQPRTVRSQEVLSMYPFRGKLYVGTNRPTELIRIDPDDTWELVVGEPRDTPQGPKRPISGQPTGFGNPFNGHFWRMEEHEGQLYVGTWDWSVQLRTVPAMDEALRDEYGLDLFASPDGKFWYPITRDGFGDGFNYGARSLVSTPFGLMVGTANPYYGAEVWQVQSHEIYKARIPLIYNLAGDTQE